MRKSAQYLVASALAAALVGGLALAATKLPPAKHAVVYIAPNGQGGIGSDYAAQARVDAEQVRVLFWPSTLDGYKVEFGQDNPALGTPPVALANNRWPQSNEVLANCQPLVGMPEYAFYCDVPQQDARR
jgi:hypothetical protein